jgi:tetratricopeptide (TPR) repeat protein
VFIADDFAHDRYLYLPSVGLAVLMAMLLRKVCMDLRHWLGFPASFLAAGLCLAAALSYGTLTESTYFRDNLTFYAYNLSKAPHNPYAESNYASTLAEGGQYGPALEKFIDVVNHHPDYYAATYNLAFTYYKMGMMPQAEEYFLRAIRINPSKPDQYFYLGMTRFKTGRIDEAIACVRQAIAIRPRGFAYHFALGVMLKTQGDLTGALQEFREELADHPEEQAAAAQAKEIESQLPARPANIGP